MKQVCVPVKQSVHADMSHPGKHSFCREVSRRLSLFCAFSPMQRPPDGKQSIGQSRRSAMSAVSPVQILKIRCGIIRFRIVKGTDRLHYPKFLCKPFLCIFTGIRNYPFFLFHPVLPSCSCRPPGIISLLALPSSWQRFLASLAIFLTSLSS